MTTQTAGNETSQEAWHDNGVESPLGTSEVFAPSRDSTSPDHSSDEPLATATTSSERAHDTGDADQEALDEKLEENQSHYSDEGFWSKAKKYAKKAGEKTMTPALKMYYSAQDPDTPTWAKSTMYGALGYFILPLDAIPDITPVAGYTDDIGILAGAIGVVAAHIKDEHIDKASQTLARWFR